MVELQVYKLVLGKECDLTLAVTALKQLCLCLCLLLSSPSGDESHRGGPQGLPQPEGMDLRRVKQCGVLRSLNVQAPEKGAVQTNWEFSDR